MDPTVTPEQKEHFRTQTDEYLNYRKDVESELNKRFKFVSNLLVYIHPHVNSQIDPQRQ